MSKCRWKLDMLRKIWHNTFFLFPYLMPSHLRMRLLLTFKLICQ